jgi:hypothetical protein
MYPLIYLSCLFFASFALVGSNPVAADEFIIDDQATGSSFSLGDFNCSPCPEQVTRALGIFDHKNSGEVSAGQLWKFFHEQGVDSLDRLTLCLDVDQMDSQFTFELQSINLQIQDPLNRSKMLTNVSLGNNNILVPGNKTSSFKPEAKLEFNLGYDFMERFSADSTEIIKLDFSSNSEFETSPPRFSIEGNGNVFNRFNVVLLIGFAGFWLLVFFVLNRVTKPLADAASIPKAHS